MDFDERRKNPQVQEGMEVLDSDGSLVGFVTKVRKADFRLHRTIAPDLYLSFIYVESITGNRVTLTIREHEIAAMNWPPRSSGSAGPGEGKTRGAA